MICFDIDFLRAGIVFDFVALDKRGFEKLICIVGMKFVMCV